MTVYPPEPYGIIAVNSRIFAVRAQFLDEVGAFYPNRLFFRDSDTPRYCDITILLGRNSTWGDSKENKIDPISGRVFR